MRELTNYTGVLALILAMFVIGVFSEWASAQITIKERMELKSKASARVTTQRINELPDDPVIYPLQGGDYLVLKTGTLKLFVAGAQGYGTGDATNTRFVVERSTLEDNEILQIETTYSLNSYLSSPIVIKDRSKLECSDSLWFYRQ